MKLSDLPAPGRGDEEQRISLEKPVRIQLAGIAKDKVSAIIKPLSGVDQIEARTFAIKRAKVAGAEPKQGDEVYDTSYAAAVVARGYYDSDSPAEKREFMFRDAEEVLKLTGETVIYLYQIQDAWQEETSPSFKVHSTESLMGAVYALAKDDQDIFFSQCSPATQNALGRFMAGRLVALLATSSLYSLRSTPAPIASSERPKPLEQKRSKVTGAKSRPRRG